MNYDFLTITSREKTESFSYDQQNVELYFPTQDLTIEWNKNYLDTDVTQSGKLSIVPIEVPDTNDGIPTDFEEDLLDYVYEVYNDDY